MLTHWPAILCLIAGLGLVIFEMFTPGFHIPGLVGSSCCWSAWCCRPKRFSRRW
jgi:membrane protein implicated in regulation of membrane protease activity